MYSGSRAPFPVSLCEALVRAASRIVPVEKREAWLDKWLSGIRHRWQFLYHSGFWSRGEAFRLLLYCLGCLPSAAWFFVWRDSIRVKVGRFACSPWTCLGVLGSALLILAATTGGFPATRQLLAVPFTSGTDDLLYVWRHPVIGGGDRAFPAEVVSAWAAHSQQLKSVAPFQISKAQVGAPVQGANRPLVVDTEPSLFKVLQAQATLGRLPVPGTETPDVAVLDHAAWKANFHSNPNIVGSSVRVGRNALRIVAVLSPSFRFVSRQPSIYLVQSRITDPFVMVIARARPGASTQTINKELTKIAENSCYYFYFGQLRIRSLRTSILTPLGFFAVAFLGTALLTGLVTRVRTRGLRVAWQPSNRHASLRRAGFFTLKTALGLMLVFIAGLEWSRPEHSILFASKDPANGPLLVWIYVAGAMAVLFWAVADGRTRCRECLRLLGLPVRMGCPGCFFLTWSGTELLCSQGHGVLHVPHLAPSWDEESEHWIPLDESWRGLFTR